MNHNAGSGLVSPVSDMSHYDLPELGGLLSFGSKLQVKNRWGQAYQHSALGMSDWSCRVKR